MAEDIVRVRAVVRGRVQGVWFRQSTADAVTGTGVAGWVRNVADGSVEAVFEGERTAVDRALAYVGTGPPRAAVASVETTWEQPRGESGFTVRG